MHPDKVIRYSKLHWRNVFFGAATFSIVIQFLSINSFLGVSADVTPNGKVDVQALKTGEDSFQAFEKLLVAEAGNRAGRNGGPDHLGYVFELIGTHRISRAAPVLLDRLESQPVYPSSAFSRFANFPAAAALVAIGSPCRDSIFNYLRESRTERQTDIIAFVLAEIYHDNEIASLVVKKELKRVQSIPERKINTDLTPFIQNLERVIRLLESKDYSEARNWPK